jgi:hypothetical protein
MNQWNAMVSSAYALNSARISTALGYTPFSASAAGALNAAAYANPGAQGIASDATINLSAGSWKYPTGSNGITATMNLPTTTDKIEQYFCAASCYFPVAHG